MSTKRLPATTEHTERAPTGGDHLGPNGGDSESKPVVLIVDDVPANLVAFEGMLVRDDIEIVTASSGTEALELLLARDVALAIIDVQMPEMDGFALAELLRGVERTRNVPIIFVTAAAHDYSSVFKGYEAGAVDFLFKPVDQHVLRGKVDVFVRLEQQRQQLLRAERTREMMLGILSHDLRNPLHGISIASQLALRRASGDAVSEPLQRVLRTSRRMERMIEQLLDFTRIRAGGGVTLAPTPADLRTIVEDIVEEHEEHKRRFRIDVRGDASGSWDADRLAQVVSNLVANAAEHSPPDSPIEIGLDGTDVGCVVLDVRNAGVIPEELREVLFEPFRGRKHGRGLGLGLFVSRQFVAAHRGQLDYQSSDVNGTRFVVRLPRISEPH